MYLGHVKVLLGMFLSLKTLYRKRTVIWPFYFYTIIRTLSEDIEITNNYVLSRKDNNYHFLLFNKINDRYMSDVKQDFIFHNELPQDSLMIIKTLNHEHGSIQHLLPISDQLVYIEKEILDELDKTNYPKTELAVQEETGRTFELKLNHDEVKYICFKPS
ncbi:AraC family transcription regulator [Staphylococcus aureus]|nr:AraC family transcription regulator [Staphylococcus aureus]GBX50513.1 AraC family transcription regulator [Staphylococcus aureus]CAC8468950.1 AraC family transcriptional regulator [Staphylococcus aureus]